MKHLFRLVDLNSADVIGVGIENRDLSYPVDRKAVAVCSQSHSFRVGSVVDTKGLALVQRHIGMHPGDIAIRVARNDREEDLVAFGAVGTTRPSGKVRSTR